MLDTLIEVGMDKPSEFLSYLNTCHKPGSNKGQIFFLSFWPFGSTQRGRHLDIDPSVGLDVGVWRGGITPPTHKSWPRHAAHTHIEN